ncbi:MAG: formyltransferase [Ottowia sp.]|nr:formyltransferase [Ottowia sp.]
MALISPPPNTLKTAPTHQQPRRCAVVFAYHNVGIRCLNMLLAHDIDIALVISHQDDAQETIWFESVPQRAAICGLPCITPDHPNQADLSEHIAAIAPDFIFSFYYRHMIPASILATAKIGAFNMHGSLLPKYRGRAPVNWAILHGETQTGATLHEMVIQPDAGAIIEQTAVPILPDDVAHEVFTKVCVAAELTLWRALPALISGHIQRLPNLLAQGQYFGARKAEDGRINWSHSARDIYNLYRAVAPPYYPGAFTEINTHRFIIAQAQRSPTPPALRHLNPHTDAGLHIVDQHIFGLCGDGQTLAITALTFQGQTVSPEQLATLLALPSVISHTL